MKVNLLPELTVYLPSVTALPSTVSSSEVTGITTLITLIAYALVYSLPHSSTTLTVRLNVPLSAVFVILISLPLTEALTPFSSLTAISVDLTIAPSLSASERVAF